MSKNKKYDQLGKRMKRYEQVAKSSLMRRTPVMIRVDGKAFHTFTKGMIKPFDENLMNAMKQAAIEICNQAQGSKIAYTQSDEISILLVDYENRDSEAWFDYEVQKLVSVSASIFSAYFNQVVRPYTDKIALCDSRVFNLPKEEVVNYFIWRQQDATKNAISMIAQANFSHKSLQGLNGSQMQEKLFQEKGINFNDVPTWQKRGLCVTSQPYMKGEAERFKWDADFEIPIFTKEKDYINKFVFPIQKYEVERNG